MFENIIKFFKKLGKKEQNKESSDTAKERLHLVLMQDRANVSADFLDLMRQEIIEVIKKYIDIDEKAIDVRLTNKTNEDGTVGAPALYANIPIVTIKNEARVANVPQPKAEETPDKEDKKIEDQNDEKQPEEILEDAKQIQSEVEKENKSEEISPEQPEELASEENAEETKPEKGEETEEKIEEVKPNA